MTSDRLTVEGVARLLDVAPSTIYAYVARGQMPVPSPCPCCGHGPTWQHQTIIDWQIGRYTP